MSGMVFHPGHHELHGVTVVVDGRDGRTWVGRFDREDERGVHLMGVSVWDPATAHGPVEAFLDRTRRFGVKAEIHQLTLSLGDVDRIRRLGDL
jgi:hypothetical protein